MATLALRQADQSANRLTHDHNIATKIHAPTETQPATLNIEPTDVHAPADVVQLRMSSRSQE